MDEKTLAALRGSIEKWEAIVSGTGGDNGSHNCPLCALFFASNSAGCLGCPVMDRTGGPFCSGSPYEEWSDHHADHIDNHDYSPQGQPFTYSIVPGCDTCVKLVRNELEFLKSLLPAP